MRNISIFLSLIININVAQAGSDIAGRNDYLKAQSPFAVEVTASSGYGPVNLYQAPQAVLGKPHPLNSGWGPCPAGPVSMIEPTFGTDPITREHKITTIKAGQEITVAFDHPIKDDPENPYGIDFIVFGNPMFVYGGYANIPYTKPIADKTSVFAEQVTVSVSPDGKNWYTYESGPYGDDMFPTQAVKMRPDNTFRDEEKRFWEKNFTKPADPKLTVDDFGGITVYDADQKYGVSAGGTGFDLKDSGFEEIKYVKLKSDGGEIDAISDVDPDLDELHVVPENGISLDVEPGDLSIRWEAPQSKGDVTYHINLYGNSSSSDISRQVTGSGYIETTLENLKGNQGYRLYITADYENVSGNKKRESGLWQFYTKNRSPEITNMTPGDGNSIPIDGQLRIEAQDPDGDDIGLCLFLWSGDVKGDISPDRTYTVTPSDKSYWAIGLSEDLEVSPESTYTWQVTVSDDQGDPTQSRRFTFKTSPTGYSRRAIDEGSISGDISLMPFHALDIVPDLDLTDLKHALSFEIVLCKEPGSTDITSMDPFSLKVDFNASADRVLGRSIAFNIASSGDANAAILPVTLSFLEEDFKTLGIDPLSLTEDNLLGKLHPAKIVNGNLFDLVEIAGSKNGDIFNVTKVASSGNRYSVEFSLLLMDSDSVDVKAVSVGDRSYIAVWDGKKDGKLSDPITAITPKGEVQPTPSPSPSPSPSDGGSGGCSLSTNPMVLVLLVPMIGMLRR